MSADPFDDAAELEEAERRYRIERARHEKIGKSIGRCFYCNAELEHGKRWCDSDCREDWEMQQEAAVRSHGRV